EFRCRNLRRGRFLSRRPAAAFRLGSVRRSLGFTGCPNRPIRQPWEAAMTPWLAEIAESLSPQELMGQLLSDEGLQNGFAANMSRVCITCSFQAEDMVALHMLRQRLPNVPVLFLDTGYHFAETYDYRDRMAAAWSLNLRNLLPATTVAQQENALGILYQ